MKNVVIGTLLVICGAVILGTLRKCVVEPNSLPIDRIKDSLKVEIRKELGQKDSVQKEIVYRDSIQKVVVWKYRTDKGLKLPCDTLIRIVEADCDTVIKVDSTLISKLKVELMIDGLIIANQGTIIKRDSVQIDNLNRKIKRHKRQKKLLLVVAGALGIVSVLK